MTFKLDNNFVRVELIQVVDFGGVCRWVMLKGLFDGGCRTLASS